MAESDWEGDLDDDCWIDRYGMRACVEKSGRCDWWFAIYSQPWKFGDGDLYNTADNETPVRLTTGKMARAAAEIAMEVLRGAALLAGTR
jgi:hypothetical protein